MNRVMGHPYRRFGMIAVVLVVSGALVLAVWLGFPPVAAWIVALSVVTFAFYGFDKHRARSGGTRVPEIVLHTLALAGGFPGGWVGRAVFHHKTQHQMFLIVLSVSTVLWLGASAWLWLA